MFNFGVACASYHEVAYQLCNGLKRLSYYENVASDFILLPESLCGFEKLTHVTQFAPYRYKYDS